MCSLYYLIIVFVSFSFYTRLFIRTRKAKSSGGKGRVSEEPVNAARHDASGSELYATVP